MRLFISLDFDWSHCCIIVWIDSNSSTEIFHRAFANHRPEMGESSAESVARHVALQRDINNMKIQRQLVRQSHTDTTSNLPSQPTLTNHAQEVQLTTSYNLYENPTKRITTTTQEILFDTGAGLTMISGQYDWTWTNLRDCMYAIGGCFVGLTYSNLKIGEYHCIMTLDSNEMVRITIPEAVQLPPGAAHNNLLANTAFLLAGHKYISDLYQPKLKFKEGGQRTLSVTKGHLVFSVLPVSATQDTSHRTIYLHNNEPYDPPTYVNDTIFQHANRANL
jgi:hypothetical protein